MNSTGANTSDSWLQEKFILNIPSDFIVVLDNVLCHTVQENKAHISASCEAEIRVR
jgi:hypothetical protein